MAFYHHLLLHKQSLVEFQHPIIRYHHYLFNSLIKENKIEKGIFCVQAEI